ncbi:MAG: serine protease AprX [Actinomycetota bacterium]|nr:serine protease AprX [Actinomycetota bacterium]
MTSSATQAISRTAALLAFALAATGVAAVPASSAPATRVVVTSVTGDVAGAVRAVESAGGKVLDRLSLIGGVSASLPAGSVLAPTFRVVPDSELRVAGKDASASGTVSAVRATLGLGPVAGEGAGVTVAVVDTGVADVADLQGRVEHVNVSGASGGDGYGHGTFVAGLVAGDGSSSDGLYAGVAPAARILDVKVADAEGVTNLVTVLKGLQKVAGRSDVDVLNLSLSSGSPLPYQVDPLTMALDALWRRGVTVVVPAGNEGPGANTVTSPGTDPTLLTAGSLDDQGTARRNDDVVSDWSGRGTRGHPKPDLVAAGSHVVSLRAPGSAIDAANASARIGNGYFKGSGTSFSTAIASGAAAALLSRRTDLRPAQVKDILTGSAYSASGLHDRTAAGAGGLDLAAAYSAKSNATDETIPGDPAVWAAFIQAVTAGDASAAARNWAQLSPQARNWAARNWAELDLAARNWAASSWSARNWAGATPEEWAARNWAAGNWAARNWADTYWNASSWSARNWAAGNWAGNWAASSWSAGNWAAGNWAAGNWAAGNWAASSWSAGNWAAGNWAAGNWAAGNWSASSWSAGNWAAGNWAAGNWAAGNWSALNWG